MALFRKKPVLYHYCVMRQPSPGAVEYFHGSSEQYPPLATNADYTDFCERLAADLGVPRKGLTIVSLSRL